MVWLYLLFAVAPARCCPFSSGSTRSSRTGSAARRAAFVSFLVGTIALLIISAFVRKPLPSLARLGDVPWWVWIGGLLGAFYVAGSIVTAPKLGAVTLAPRSSSARRSPRCSSTSSAGSASRSITRRRAGSSASCSSRRVVLVRAF
jgi:hypothetical protein